MNGSPDEQISEGVSAPSAWRRIWKFPIYPLIAACLPLLNIFASNTSLFPDATALVRPVAFSVLAAALLTFIASLLLRDRHRGALLTTVFLMLLAYGERAAEPIALVFGQAAGLAIGPEYPLLVIFAALSLIVTLGRIRSVVTVAANVWVIVMLILYTAIWGLVPFLHLLDGNERENLTPPDVFAGAQATGSKPDIYHITLDGYARADILRELYEFDNTDFLDRIRGLGFAVAERATTPYNQTQLVMLSIFEGSYLDWFGEVANGSPGNYRDRIRERFLENSTITALTRMEYQIAATHVEYSPVDIGRHDMIAPRPWLELTFFERVAFERNALSLFANKIDLLSRRENHTISMIRDAYSAPFSKTLGRPVFLYTHQIAPHPPFDVSRDGKHRRTIRRPRRLADATGFHEGQESLRLEYKNGYVEKLLFINDETTGYLERLIRELPDPKIVILHGDHGGGIYVDQENLDTTCVKERFSPLLAVYSSDGLLQARLGDDFNLVNLYRLIFNTYFETDLPMLESENYFAPYPAPSNHRRINAEGWEKSCQPTG